MVFEPELTELGSVLIVADTEILAALRPWCGGSAGGAVFFEQCGERGRDRDRVGADDQTQLVRGDDDVGGLPRGDLDQWLA